MEDLRRIEAEAEERVLAGGTLVCGVHGPAHRRSAVVPLRWGSPRIVVLPGGFRFHLGEDLADEAFAAARLWRSNWDPMTDLAVSRRSPERRPAHARRDPVVDRLIRGLTWETRSSTPTPSDPLGLSRLRDG